MHLSTPRTHSLFIKTIFSHPKEYNHTVYLTIGEQKTEKLYFFCFALCHAQFLSPHSDVVASICINAIKTIFILFTTWWQHPTMYK